MPVAVLSFAEYPMFEESRCFDADVAELDQDVVVAGVKQSHSWDLEDDAEHDEIDDLESPFAVFG